jgi:RNase P/RNase MRP subunit p30
MDKIMNTLPDNHISNETLWTYKDNIEIFNKYNQQVIHSIKKPEMKLKSESDPEIKLTLKSEPEPEMKKQKLSKQKTESPVDLILRLTLVDKIMKQDIKNKLIEFISVPEFSKVFGMKKTSEIMTAISKESWNQSISLFISFLLDKNIIYKEKSYIYNKEKVISEQSIIIS